MRKIGSSRCTEAIQKGADFFASLLPLMAGHPIPEGSIVFFDEVQDCPEIITSIRYLVENGKYRYIMSGSLLGVEFSDLRSAPVGFLSILDMFPLGCEEFIRAFGGSDELFERLRYCFENTVRIDNVIHEQLLDLFYEYLVIGGMPEAVQKYIDTQDFYAVSNIHDEIRKLYTIDFCRYEDNDKKLKLRKIYELIPSELDAENRRYVFTDIDPHFMFVRYENSFNWLIDSGVAIAVNNVREPMIPLLANRERNLMKLFLSDCGMLSSVYGPSTQLKLLQREESVSNGAVFENYVAEELCLRGRSLYYSSIKKYGEMDFVREGNGKISLIEVKSGKDYRKHGSPDRYLSVPNRDIGNAYVLCTGNIEREGRITYLPIYLTCLIAEERKPELPRLKIDLSSLRSALNPSEESRHQCP
ncbi:MAG: ATP-binding protein [Bullifex sp.]